MGETGRLAVFHGTGKPFEIREYPVPEPEPGAILIRIALANVCGSDMHYWRGEQNYEKMGRPLPLNTGHEHVGTVARLGPGVTTDSTGQPLQTGDRVLYRYFFPCGRCKACLRRQYKSCPVRQANWLVRGVAALPGGLRPVLLPPAEPRRVQAPRRDHRRDGGGHQLRLHAGLRGARHRPAPRGPDGGGAGRGRARRLRVRGGAGDGRQSGDRHRRRGRATRARQAVRRHRGGGPA